jgi:hypothetical protein
MSNILKGLIFEEEQTSYSIHLKDNDKPLLKYNSIPELKSAYAGLTKKYPDREFTIKKTSCSTTELGRPEFLESAQKISEEELNEDLRKWFKEKWVRFGPDGKIRGDCARGDDSEGKPKCLPQAKAHSLGKKGRKYAASKKRREDPDPERKGAAKNVATKKKSNESMVEGNIKEIELKFKTIELSNDNIVSYAKNYFESNNIEAPYQKFISNIKLLSNAKLTESKENAEIQEFIKALERVDSKKKIKVGDKFAVLAFEIRFAWREIDALGFTEPKEVADIKLHSDGTINYIKFTDGDRYPRLIQATHNNKPIVQAVYFDDKNKAEKALTYLTMLIPDNWEIDMNSLVRQETTKDVTEEQLDELKCWPGYTRVQGVPAGAPGSCKKKTNEEDLGMTEGQPIVSVKKWAEQVRQEHGVDTKFWNDKVHNRIIARKDKEIVGSYDRKANNGTVFSPEQDIAEGSDDTVYPNAEVIKSKNGKPVGEIYQDGNSWGAFHYRADRGYDMIDSREDAIKALKDLHQETGRSRPDYTIKGVAEEKCPHCTGPMFSEALMMEKKDACYYKVKSRYKVWPSAYASGALVKCRKKGAKNWGQ